MYKSFKNIIYTSIVTAIIFTATGCSLIKEPKSKMAVELLKPEEKKFETYTVKTGSVRYEHGSNGWITSSNIVNINSSISGGVIEKVYVDTWSKVKKGDVIVKYYTKDIENKIEVQDLVVKQCESELKMLKNDNSNQYKIEKAELQVEEEKVKLRQLNEDKNARMFRSPIDGMISKLTSAKIGDVVGMNEPIATVMDASSLLVMAEIDDNKAFKNYYAGMKCEVSYQNKPYKAVVKDVGVGIGEKSLNKNTGVAKLEIKEKLPDELKLEDLVQYKVFGDEKDNVIVIPISFLRSDELRNLYVYVIKDEIREKRIVETGISNINVVEIKSGLAVNEVIIAN